MHMQMKMASLDQRVEDKLGSGAQVLGRSLPTILVLRQLGSPLHFGGTRDLG